MLFFVARVSYFILLCLYWIADFETLIASEPLEYRFSLLIVIIGVESVEIDLETNCPISLNVYTYPHSNIMSSSACLHVVDGSMFLTISTLGFTLFVASVIPAVFKIDDIMTSDFPFTSFPFPLEGENITSSALVPTSSIVKSTTCAPCSVIL